MQITYPVHWPAEQAAASNHRGWSTNPRHSGIDYGWRAEPNTTKSRENLAVAAGRVESVTDNGGFNQGWGNRVWVQHTDRAATTYNHGATGSAKVRKGATVKAGQVVSSQGETGDARGVHLHFELYIDGVRVDPQPYLNGKPLPGAPVVKEDAGGQPAGGATYAQRTVKNVPLGYINGRASASLGGSVRQKLNKGVVGNFDAFTRGQKVTQNGVTSDVWFRGAFNHNWFWAGNFTSQSTTGMKNLTPAKPAPAKKQFKTPPEGQFYYVNYNDARNGRNYVRTALPGGRTYTVEKNYGNGTLLISIPGVGNRYVGTARNPAKAS